MSFFYDLNKKLDSIRATPEVTHQQLNERDEGKPGKNFAKIAKDASERYGSKAAGERVAGAVRNKLKAQGKLEEEGMSRAAKGYEKYGKQGMQALAKAGREGKSLDPIRKKYDKYDNDQVDEVANAPAAPAKKASPGFGKDYKPLVPDTEKPGSARGTIKGGTFQADPKGRVKPPSGDPEGVKEQNKKDFNKDIDPKFKDMPKREVDRQIRQMSRDYEFNKDIDPKIRNMPKSEVDRQMRGDALSSPQQVKEKLSPAKQKSFAALAPPRDKITFADKIAGAKKEVDEMLGDVAAEAMRSALGGGRGRNAEMEEERSKGTAFDMSAPRDAKPKVGSVERGAKHDIKHTATGRIVTRRTDDQGISVDSETDDEGNKKEKRTKAGRPDGSKNVSSKAKVFQRKSKLMTKEGEDDPAEKGEYDREGDMALDDIDTIESAANELQSIIDADDNLPEWVQSKINKAMDYLDTARDYMAAQGNDQEPIAEKAVSKQQQKFMGMAHAMQKGEKIKGASKELKKVAKTMKPKDVEDFAKTKHKGLPEKAKKKEVDENSQDGRLTTTQTGPGKTSTSSTTGRISATVDKGKVEVKPAKSGGMSFGKGIYDSMNRELELMIAESMSVNMSDSTEGNKSLTVTATDDDAMKLAMILKSAGLGGGDMHSHSEQPCPTCGMPDCGCGDVQEAVDENAPDYPTNTQTSSDALQYAGGLNKPKTDVAGDGQTTVPNTAVHTQEEDALRRMMEMAGLAEAAKPDFLDKDGNKEESMKDAVKDKKEDTVEESIRRMREMAGIQEAKKEVDEADMEEGNKFAHNVLKAKAAGKKEADLDGDGDMEKVRESIFTLTNQWRTYKG